MTPSDPMPFGKYKGQPMSSLPTPYLEWLEKQIRPKAPNKRLLAEKHVLEYIDRSKNEK